MSQSATRLVSKLRYKLRDRRNLKSPAGPQGRHDKIRKVVSALFKHERIELNFNTADEARGYAERLISDAIRYGDCHKPTMEMASYWLLEPQLVHKLFKVLAPRYENYTVSYTKSWRAPYQYPKMKLAKCVLELRDNVYPPLGPDKTNHKNLIHNVLLAEAKKVYMNEKAMNSGGVAGSQETSAEQESGNRETVDQILDENQNSEELAASETNEKMLNEEIREKEPERVQMSEAKEEDLTSKENSESSSPVEKELNLGKMKITEEKKSPDKEK